jgi:DNA modification methylase
LKSGSSLNLIHGDCVEVMKTLATNSIDLIVTSPPYDNLRDYNNSSMWNFEVFKLVAQEIYRVIKPGSCVVWIVNDATINGSETGSSFRQALYFKEIGFCLHDTMIWKKPSAYQHKNRYIASFEYMFVFSKGPKRKANLIADRCNKLAGTNIHGPDRLRNGLMRPRSDKQTSKKVKPFGNRINVWDHSPNTHNKTGHPAVFPVSLVEDHIKTWSDEGQTVLDPFMGSGTTGLACKNLKRNFIGIEIDSNYFKVASGRVKN